MAEQRPVTRISELSEATEIDDNAYYIIENELGVEQKVTGLTLKKLRVTPIDSVADLAGLVGSVDGQQISVSEYHSDYQGGGGVFVWSAGSNAGIHDAWSFIDPLRSFPADFNDQTQVNLWFLNSTSPVSGWKRILKTDNVIDDMTQAGVRPGSSYALSNRYILQAYVNNEFDIEGGQMPLGSGDFYIEDSVDIPFAVGFNINGVSKIETKLIQTLDNTPHFHFKNDLTHSWSIKNLTFSWLNQQTSTDTLAKACYFDSSTSPADTDNFFLWTLDQITFEKGWELFGTNEANNNLIWGISMPLVTISNTTVGRAFSALHGGTAGQPSNSFGYLLIDAASMTTDIIACKTFNFVADIIEILGGGDYPAMNINEGEAIITQFKCEGWVVGAPMAGRGIIEKINTGLVIEEIKCDLRSIDVGVGNDLYLIKTSSTPNGDDFIGKLSLNPAVPLVSGNPIITNNNGELGRLRIRSMRTVVDFKMSDTASTAAADWLTVDEWLNNQQSADNGDADVVLDFGDQTVQQFNTTLTANRTIELPGPRIGISDIFNGLKYKVVRNATVPGAFTLSILQDGGGTLFTIPTNTNMILEYTYRRLGWVLTNKVTL